MAYLPKYEDLAGTVPLTALPTTAVGVLGVCAPDGLTIISSSGTLSAMGGSIPPQSGYAGQFLMTNGLSANWALLDGGTF